MTPGGRFPRAIVTCRSGIMEIRLALSRPLRVEAGQYINICIPDVSFWSFAQSPPMHCYLRVKKSSNSFKSVHQTRQGFSRAILEYAQRRVQANPDRIDSTLALFSGPHGKSVSIENYKTILMIASGFGIVTELPYLKRLIFDLSFQLLHLLPSNKTS